MRCGLVALGFVALSGCGSHAESQTAPADAGDRPGPWAEADAAPPEPPVSDTWLPAPKPSRVGVAHILVAFKGAENAPKAVTRTKEEAKARADEALRNVNQDAGTFGDVAKQYSDDAQSKKIGGAIGNIEEWVMPEAFFATATSLKVGETSGVIETPRGFHIIQRTK